MLDRLIKWFPGCDKGIKSYFKLLNAVDAATGRYFAAKLLPEWLDKRIGGWMRAAFLVVSERPRQHGGTARVVVVIVVVTCVRGVRTVLGRDGWEAAAAAGPGQPAPRCCALLPLWHVSPHAVVDPRRRRRGGITTRASHSMRCCC